ncbi:hypothetical protein I7I50_03491 [Histoplasma capsulatum G186AR]|uniref:Uncharacterized protein n=1 Tax=Ajellomyces capsulatus TaxID=5037 RepID=A0A8H7YNH8_AJECA|nr:hypothetical protein I7I52_04398 [Histoplasma capsulatum]QSS74623.1 hypothetical protein I7I50_03491 [Histoplasma capsulatum G186AR]
MPLFFFFSFLFSFSYFSFGLLCWIYASVSHLISSHLISSQHHHRHLILYLRILFKSHDSPFSLRTFSNNLFIYCAMFSFFFSSIQFRDFKYIAGSQTTRFRNQIQRANEKGCFVM